MKNHENSFTSSTEVHLENLITDRVSFVKHSQVHNENNDNGVTDKGGCDKRNPHESSF